MKNKLILNRICTLHVLFRSKPLFFMGKHRKKKQRDDSSSSSNSSDWSWSNSDDSISSSEDNDDLDYEEDRYQRRRTRRATTTKRFASTEKRTWSCYRCGLFGWGCFACYNGIRRPRFTLGWLLFLFLLNCVFFKLNLLAAFDYQRWYLFLENAFFASYKTKE